MNPKYPLYIITYKRWDTRMTERALEEMKVPYFLVVDKDDIPKYAAKASKYCTILELPKHYREEYDTFWKSEGPLCSGPARNFVWDHSQNAGDKRHWVLDDNIGGFVRLYKNKKIMCKSGSFFKAMEDFTDRFSNVAISGPDYRFFAEQNTQLPPYVVNHKMYSCLLINNEIPFRWRGRYNEDVDLCIRVMKGKLCIIQFKAFLQNKAATQTVKGGNNEAIYQDEGTLKKTQMLKEMHPDVVEMVLRYGRPHHFVNYKPFERFGLKPIEGLKIKKGINEYGMKLIEVPR